MTPLAELPKLLIVNLTYDELNDRTIIFITNVSKFKSKYREKTLIDELESKKKNQVEILVLIIKYLKEVLGGWTIIQPMRLFYNFKMLQIL